MSSAPSHIRRNEPWSKIHLLPRLAERRSHAGKDEILHEYRADRGDTPSRVTALIFAGTAMVLGILWVNSGTSQQASNDRLPRAAAKAARYRGAGNRHITRGPRRSRDRWAQAGATPTHRCSIPQQGSGLDGQIVPAMQPGAAPDRPSGRAQPDRRTTRRSTLIAYGGRSGGETARPGGGGLGRATDRKFRNARRRGRGAQCAGFA
jgi:type IV secretion system protein VirB10